ncbi:MAG: polysaccharide biosynthesis tyrosine autokinase [Verrucomicrobia bacterium]|nr:polysaccharide biosynthesis tyrosine autokinase [Verrucomicrobiota bacterium]
MESVKNAPQSESKLHFLDYWRIIRIRKSVILLVFLLVVITTTAVTLILPPQYLSMVRIAVEKDATDISGLFQRDSIQVYDPYFIQTEFEKITSKKVLHKVIEDMGLNNEWAKRYNSEGPLKTSETYEILKRHIDVRQTRNTSLIEISVRSEDRREAANLCNKIAETYKENRLSLRRDMSDKGITKLKDEYQLQLARVHSLQSNAAELRLRLKISDYVAEGNAPVTTLEPETVRRLENEHLAARGELAFYTAKLDDLRSMNRENLRKAILSAEPDDLLKDLFLRLNDTEQRWSALNKDVGDLHPEVIKTKALLSTLNTQIEARIDGILMGLGSRLKATTQRALELSNQVAVAIEKDAKAASEYRPYFLIKGELETEKRILETMKFKIVQEEVDLSLPKSSIVEVTDRAEESQKPFRPNIPLNIGLGVVVGLLIGVGLAFFIEYLDTSVKTIDDVERALQAPVLGVIPQNVGSLLEEGADSPHAEAYRVLRTNVLFSQKDPQKNTLTVVSGGAGEGKSTTIFNLATIFAQHGSRVLVVDSDLRRPSLHKILKVSNTVGLTNYLLKQNSLEEVIQTTKQPGLDFLPSGKLPSSSLGILNSTQMREFIREAKKRYDYVFFDSPPIMGVSDASILASEVDLALLVIQYRKYPQAMTVRAKQMVEKVGGTLLGVVLNNINISQDSYYYYYSGYYYDYYSRNDEGGGKKNGEHKKAAAQAGETPERGGGVEIKQKY